MVMGIFRRWIPRLFRGYHDEEIREMHDPLSSATNTPELIEYHGYECEEHLVVTADGYVLQLHRILPLRSPPKDESEGDALPSPEPSISGPSRSGRTTGPPVLAIHGAMLSSEIWLAQRQAGKNLVLRLVDAGYDVWLANRRGTRYSQKHLVYKPQEERFWDYSIDETIIHDVPAQVEYILAATGHRQCSLLGFSQGTAEALGAMAFSQRLHRRISCMVGLSATAKPPAPRNPFIHSMVHWTPELVFLLFGRKSMLKSVYFWQSVLSPKAMSWLMDHCMRLLFGWRNRNIRPKDKPLLYRHLFASASVKQIAHWFQIMRANRFQMYDDAPPGRHSQAPEYPLRNITRPLILFLGDHDCLTDAHFVETHLPAAEMHLMAGYEHMDTIWSHDADQTVHPHVLQFLELYAPTGPKSHRSPPSRRLASSSLSIGGESTASPTWPPVSASVASDHNHSP